MEKMLGLGDSLLLQINPILEKSLKERNISYNHLSNSVLTNVNLNLENEYNIGPSTNLPALLNKYFIENKYFEKLVIHVGLHDIKVLNDGNNLVDIKIYEDNLRKVIQILPNVSKKIYWCLIPKIYNQHHNAGNMGFKRYDHDVIKYNEITKKILSITDVIVIDTYKIMEKIGVKNLIDHVHFNEQGKIIYQENILKEILLKEQEDEKN